MNLRWFKEKLKWKEEVFTFFKSIYSNYSFPFTLCLFGPGKIFKKIIIGIVSYVNWVGIWAFSLHGTSTMTNQSPLKFCWIKLPFLKSFFWIFRIGKGNSAQNQNDDFFLILLNSSTQHENYIFSDTLFLNN